MPTFQVRVGEHSYVVVAADIRSAMTAAEAEELHREGFPVVAEAAKRVKDRVVGVPEDEAQRTLWSAKES